MFDDIPDFIGIISIEPDDNFSWAMHTYYKVEDYKKMVLEIEGFLDSIDLVNSDRSNEMDVFLQVYISLGLLMTYDSSAGMNGSDMLKNYYTTRNLYDAIFNHKCTCGGGSELLRNVLAFRGIDCINVFSISHAFNQVNVGGLWYNSDLVYDFKNIKSGFVNYCLTSDIIQEDVEHVPILGTLKHECFMNQWDINDTFKKVVVDVVNRGFVFSNLVSRADEINLERYNSLVSKYCDCEDESIIHK